MAVTSTRLPPVLLLCDPGISNLPRIRLGKLFDLRVSLQGGLCATRFQQRLHLVVIHNNHSMQNPVSLLHELSLLAGPP